MGNLHAIRSGARHDLQRTDICWSSSRLSRCDWNRCHVESRLSAAPGDGRFHRPTGRSPMGRILAEWLVNAGGAQLLNQIPCGFAGAVNIIDFPYALVLDNIEDRHAILLVHPESRNHSTTDHFELHIRRYSSRPAAHGVKTQDDRL